MSFLSAAFLIAMPLVAVPVLIHLYRGRQREVILWGAMQFLAAAVTKGRRMERLEEWILMALRLGAVAALILALARPMIRSSWLGHHAEREVILLLDNSLSMSREVDGRSAADRMKEQALELIDSLSSADAVQILLAAGNEWATAEGVPATSAGKRQLREIIEAVEPTFGTANLLVCLQAAIHLQAPEQLSGRRVVVFTDGQARSWQTQSEAAWKQLAFERDESEVPTSVEVVDCGLEVAEIDNLAVTGIRAARNLLRPGEQVDLTADLSNTGNGESTATRARWLIGETSVAELTVRALAPGAMTQATASVRMEEGGVFAITCRIDGDDQVPLDQEDSIVVEVADELPILVVDEAAAHHGTAVATHELLAAALGFKGQRPQDWHSVFRPEVIEPEALASHPLANYRAIVINNPAELDRTAMERLDAYVRTGGGLWVALGEQSEPLPFNRDWYSDGDGLAPLEIDSLAVVDTPDDVAATIHPPSRDHAATQQLANTTQLDIDEARVRQRWLFGRRHAEDAAVSALLESGNGEPLVVEKYVGHGRVLVQGFPLGLEWSNLPLLKAFVVIVHDWLAYVTAPTLARYNLSPGAAIVAVPPADHQEASAELVTPRGKKIALAAIDGDESPVFRFTQTALPGTYHVRFTSGDETVAQVPYQVARDGGESDLTKLVDEDREKLSAAGFTFGGPVAETAAQRHAAPRREPFWGLLLTALVLLLAGELLLSGGLARQRQGFSVAAH